ncbi:hypothetical protein CSC81_14085 [Tenacibaculum discolor]|uniref:DUF4870 domain-containing protein n=1 Tax=Tenacibaculum discolor TaxID=361581 RepID=A0A2G1BR13_9FLAO|nr:DUF4870 domain-containing protein [Tenacibaculum discolor]MDP2540904.1 DUF4870 domain-containing protein [Tenacibaculum discolor]PHN96480.1 hypothetical protein CSC81_14085 [Tenacibaculum discolor]
MQHNNQNTNAFLIHISAFAGYLFPLGSIITPLILWQTLKERSTFLDEHGKEAVNFNISYSLYIFILGLSFIPFFFGRIFNGFDGVDIDFDGYHGHGGLFGIFGFASIVSIVALIKIALIIIAAMKANKGEMYHYPLTIKFIK